MQLTPHFHYGCNYDVIKCSCDKCKQDGIVRIDPAILWVAESIRAVLNVVKKKHITLKINSGCRCLDHHYGIYQARGVPRGESPIKSRHVFTPTALSDALDITPIDTKGRYSVLTLLQVVEKYFANWPGGFHVYHDRGFFHLDLGESRRW